MGCNCGGKGRPSFRKAGGGDALSAAAAGAYEVIDSRGNETGRTFTSLVAATTYANSIGGTTRPA